MAGKVHFLVLFLFLVGCVSTSKTTNTPATTTDVDFLTQIERPDWKQRIDGGDIGYYNPSENTLIGLDEPPHQKGKASLQPSLNLSKRCEAHLDKIGSDITKLEFVVAKDGNLRQFFVLESAGPCDENVAAGLKQITLIPARKGEENKAALVHFRIQLD